ncbi:AAA family ATPase [Chromobacterium haemolyticum]|uniref:AAA family ATPase n=1 Tax=Chromobacterium haemolyticum TaxID=394935 RepID=UPI004055753B
MINNYEDEYLFGNEVAKIATPAKPIDSIERLLGREKYLDQIKKAFFQNGRHVFIYGDRGVGKSSLGSTAAHIHQSADGKPIIVGGSRDATFNSIISSIINAAIDHNPFQNEKTIESGNLSTKLGGLAFAKELSTKDISEKIHTVNEAASLLEKALEKHSTRPVILLDEFDSIPTESERAKFAELLKCLGDRGSSIKFIFTAIGSTLDELLGAHQSAHRQLHCIQLPRLSFESRREFVVNALEHFGLEIDDNVNWRIAIISDGFPYYLHTIVEHILWSCFEHLHSIQKVASEIYKDGLQRAIEAINIELKRPYEKAIHTSENDFEYVLWATSAKEDTHISTSTIYNDYESLVKSRKINTTPLPREKVTTIISKLKTDKYGSVLKSAERRGWLTYKDMIFRGYVRLQAEVNGIDLSEDRTIKKQIMHIPSAKYGYSGPRTPPGVNENKPIEHDD